MVVISGHSFLELHEVESSFTDVELAVIKAYYVKDLSTVDGELCVGKLTTPIIPYLQEAQSKAFWAEDDGVEPVYTEDEQAAVDFDCHVHDVLVSLGGTANYNYVVIAR